MSEAKHTPGPWTPRHTPWRGFHDDTWCIDWSEDQEEVAEIVHGDANARLIAAAPDLLESLIELMDTGFTGGPQGKRARAAIAKATGVPA